MVNPVNLFLVYLRLDCRDRLCTNRVLCRAVDWADNRTFSQYLYPFIFIIALAAIYSSRASLGCRFCFAIWLDRVCNAEN